MNKLLRNSLNFRFSHLIKNYHSLHVQPFSKMITKLLILFYGPKNRNKKMVFGIGLSRTGTASLNSALNELGIKSKHFIFYPITTNIPFLYLALKDASAATDISISANYKKIDKLYPNSKFILTVRDIESWLTSCKYYFTQRINIEKSPKWIKEIHLRLYNTLKYDSRRFKIGYYKYIDDVRKYFKNRPEDLLIIDIVRGERYEKLCPFLGLEVPKKKFPHMNIGKT